MASSILELAWTEIYNAYAAINTATDPGDGGGNYRNTIEKVYKRPVLLKNVPLKPAISVWPYKPTIKTHDTNRAVVQVDVDFIVAVFVHSYSGKDVTTEQTQLSEAFMSLFHDVMRVTLALTTGHINDDVVKFIVNTGGKPIPVDLPIDDDGNTMGVFGFKLPVMIRWYGRGLVA